VVSGANRIVRGIAFRTFGGHGALDRCGSHAMAVLTGTLRVLEAHALWSSANKGQDTSANFA